MHPKDPVGMANSVALIRLLLLGAVWSGPALFAQIYLSQYLQFSQYPIKCYRGIGFYKIGQTHGARTAAMDTSAEVRGRTLLGEWEHNNKRILQKGA